VEREKDHDNHILLAQFVEIVIAMSGAVIANQQRWASILPSQSLADKLGHKQILESVEEKSFYQQMTLASCRYQLGQVQIRTEQSRLQTSSVE
jgi:protein subunit release factor A